MSKESSPFSPGKLVPVEYFVGRVIEIERIERALNQAASKQENQNIFLTGERGIGKSSLARFIRFLAEREEYNYISTHCFLGPTKNLEEICELIFQELMRQLPNQSLFERVKGVLDKYIKSASVGAFGIGVAVEFKKDAETLGDLRLNFLPILQNVFDEIQDSRKGILIILDDLNGITRIPEFAFFLKSLVDSFSTQRQIFPLVLMLVGINERMQDMISHQPSLARIFDPVELLLMSNKEMAEFFKRSFSSVGCTIESDALKVLNEFSGGLPTLLHEIGEATFWADTDDNIDEVDSLKGVINAADNVGKKYLAPSVYQAIRSPAYLSILRRIAEPSYVQMEFTRADMLGKMSDPEKRKFDNFIRKMRELDVIRLTYRRGVYRFTNQLHRLYIGLEAKRSQA